MAHKPRNLKVATSHGTFTAACKVSAEKIKRRANKVTGCAAVYMSAESAEDHTGIQPGRKFNRRKHRSLIGTKAIATEPPADTTPHLRLTGVDEEKDWMYVVETKGGETRGREKQRYVLLRMDGRYKVEVTGNWARGGVQLLDVVLEDHTGVVAVNYASAAQREARIAMHVEAAAERTEAADEKHDRAMSYPQLSLPAFPRSFPPHSQSQPLTSVYSAQHSTSYYADTHSAPISYSPQPTETDEAEAAADDDESQQQRGAYYPSASHDEPHQRHSHYSPHASTQPYSFTWPRYPTFNSSGSYAAYPSHAQPPRAPQSVQSYPSSASTASSSSSSSAPTQRASGHHIRHWSIGSSASFASTSPYSPSSHASSSSSSVSSYASSSAASTPTHFAHGDSGALGGGALWSLQHMPAPSFFGSMAALAIKQTDSATPSASRELQTTEPECEADALSFAAAAGDGAADAMDAEPLFSECYSPLSSHSLADSTAWSPSLSSTADELAWCDLPDDAELTLPAAFLSLPPTPPPSGENEADRDVDLDLIFMQTAVCVSCCACVLLVCLNVATEWRVHEQSLSLG